MPSSTEPSTRPVTRVTGSPAPLGRWQRLRHDVADVGHLVAFRSRHVRNPRRVRIAATVLAVLLIGAATLPTLHPSAGVNNSDRAFELLLLLPTLMTGFLLFTVVSAVASGGGRELMPRDEATVFPVSPTTDHLGALLLAPLNIAWIFQAGALLGTTAFVVGGAGLATMLPFILLWLVAATAVAQVVAWTAELVRRGPRGVWTIRVVTLAVAVAALAVQLSGNTGRVLDMLPTRQVVVWGISGIEGFSWVWAGAMGVLAVVAVVAVAFGAWPAHAASRRLPRDEARAETRQHPARRMPGSDLAMLIRLDRASVWRAVPMRRGLAVLALGPGLVAAAGGLPWDSVVILPGLVASGGVLLYGVNAWCLDGRGVLWRESLPVAPGPVFAARAWVLCEWLLLASAVTLALAAVGAGWPSAAELSALVAVLVVVVVQVVAVAMTWSSRRPFAVDLRSARATPAPPMVMVGYSAKLATTTTLTGVVFSVLLAADNWRIPLVLALPFLCWSAVRLMRAHRAWTDPTGRARVAVTVAG